MATLKILVIQLTHINLLVENKWAATDSFSPLVWIVFSSPLSLYARELISKLLKLCYNYDNESCLDIFLRISNI